MKSSQLSLFAGLLFLVLLYESEKTITHADDTLFLILVIFFGARALFYERMERKHIR